MPNTPRGFTLLELLVTMIILAVGLLGVAGLQLAGMRSNHSAYLRTQANIAAYALVDQMRADPVAYKDRSFTASSQSAPASFTGWLGELATIGLSADGWVDCSGSTYCGSSHCEIGVEWNDVRGDGDLSAAASGTGSSQGRDLSALTFRLCARLP